LTRGLAHALAPVDEEMEAVTAIAAALLPLMPTAACAA
jgi:hypothetical protein